MDSEVLDSSPAKLGFFVSFELQETARNWPRWSEVHILDTIHFRGHSRGRSRIEGSAR